jgi:hypothetical protein
VKLELSGSWMNVARNMESYGCGRSAWEGVEDAPRAVASSVMADPRGGSLPGLGMLECLAAAPLGHAVRVEAAPLMGPR